MYKLLIIPFLLSVLTGFSQTRDQKAVSLLDEVSAKTKAYKSIKAEFSYTMENKQAKINEVKTGSLLIQGDKYRLSVAGQIVICDGKTIWTYIQESNEVQINNLNEKDEALTPSKLLTSYNENYKPKIIRDKNQTDPNIETVELTPKASKTITKAIVAIDKTRLQVKSFMLFDKNSNVFTYKVTKFSTDVPVTNADFSFNPKQYPGVEVIDMR
ncbi:MAG: outer membrane lipoprotein carrier protein LolA [Bacteroidetes bacterium]|nr:outer membrane lipoprotein carrier protein LolA [Bacteroidota bacterium]